jgi:hypothetical protein
LKASKIDGFGFTYWIGLDMYTMVQDKSQNQKLICICFCGFISQKPKLSITKHPPPQLFLMEVLVLALRAIFDYME